MSGFKVNEWAPSFHKVRRGGTKRDAKKLKPKAASMPTYILQQ